MKLVVMMVGRVGEVADEMAVDLTILWHSTLSKGLQYRKNISRVFRVRNSAVGALGFSLHAHATQHTHTHLHQHQHASHLHLSAPKCVLVLVCDLRP